MSDEKVIIYNKIKEGIKYAATVAGGFVIHPSLTAKSLALAKEQAKTSDAASATDIEDAAVKADSKDSTQIKTPKQPLPIKVRRMLYKEQLAVQKGGPIELATSKEPLVSIVIPVYEHFDETYRCLKAIKDTVNDIPIEVLIADDCSKYMTAGMDSIVKGVTIIKNSTNQGFLLNCNNAAAKAKGKYIVFLNNDTQPQPGWLNSLVELMESDETIGMTGSKLIYPNERLQECGGIIWKDGTGWNYGRFAKRYDEAEYSYVKEVDYISGAAIMIRRSLWKEIGGFDEQFAPAYYEDSDLAFEVRKHGYKVVIQPKSVVIHHEGISNGRDITSGQKRFQEINSVKFKEKWKDVLANEQMNLSDGLFLARDRSQFKKRMLMVDHYVPHFDQDAGGRHTFMYIKLVLSMGYKITFLTDNFYESQPYCEILNQMGVEVLFGLSYKENIMNWLKENLKYYDVVYLQRPHISMKYIDVVKQYATGKIIYDAHDLHHVRLMREYELTHNEETKKESEKWKAIEHDLFDRADVGYLVGDFERDIVAKAFPGKIVRDIPTYMYEEPPKAVSENYLERNDILFVGGFRHPPNQDAVLWFASEIYPKIKAAIPDIKWHIVGSMVSEEVQKLASDDIIIEGFVSDEKLSELYDSCRMTVAPLRFGAGVKGKILEGCYNAIPVVTTPIGAEGMNLANNPMIVVESADEIAKAVIDNYNDNEKLKRLAENGRQFILDTYTVEAAKRVFEPDLF